MFACVKCSIMAPASLAYAAAGRLLSFLSTGGYGDDLGPQKVEFWY